MSKEIKKIVVFIDASVLYSDPTSDLFKKLIRKIPNSIVVGMHNVKQETNSPLEFSTSLTGVEDESLVAEDWYTKYYEDDVDAVDEWRSRHPEYVKWVLITANEYSSETGVKNFIDLKNAGNLQECRAILKVLSLYCTEELEISPLK